MSKIITEIRYKDMSFDLIKEAKGMRLYFNQDSSFCIVVDKDNNVVFEIRAECCQNVGSLEDAS